MWDSRALPVLSRGCSTKLLGLQYAKGTQTLGSMATLALPNSQSRKAPVVAVQPPWVPLTRENGHNSTLIKHTNYIRARTSLIQCPKDCSLKWLEGLSWVSFKTSSLRMTQDNRVQQHLKNKAKWWLVRFNIHSNLEPAELEFCSERREYEIKMGVKVVLRVCLWGSESHPHPGPSLAQSPSVGSRVVQLD